MLIAQARVETERPSRYLVQLCRHANHMNQAAPVRPEMQAHARWSDAHGVISVGSGRCILRAEPGALLLRVEAPDEQTLRWVQHGVAHRLERFGRRDRLTVTWTQEREDVSKHADGGGSHG
jgi:hypothetical protein